jgi:hypothetical protein
LGVSLGVSLLFPYETPEAPKLHKGCWVFRRACVTFETMFNFLQIPKNIHWVCLGLVGFLVFGFLLVSLRNNQNAQKHPRCFCVFPSCFPTRHQKHPKPHKGCWVLRRACVASETIFNFL